MTVARLEDVVAGSEQVFPVWRLALDGLQAWKQVFERGYEGLRGQGRGERLRAGADEAVMRASLVVVFLLASVGAASAECAWVLWTRIDATRGRIARGSAVNPRKESSKGLVARSSWC